MAVFYLGIFIVGIQSSGEGFKWGTCVLYVLRHFSCVQLFATPWLAHQTHLSMGFFRREYWSGLPCPSPGHLPNPGMEPRLLRLPHCSRIIYRKATGEGQCRELGEWTQECGGSESGSVVSDSLRPQGLYSPQNSPGQNTGVGSCSLLQGICPTLVKLKSPTLQVDSLPAEPSGKPQECSRTHYSLVIQGWCGLHPAGAFEGPCEMSLFHLPGLRKEVWSISLGHRAIRDWKQILIQVWLIPKAFTS